MSGEYLNEARSLFLDNGNPVEDIDELLIKAFEMKRKKVRIFDYGKV